MQSIGTDNLDSKEVGNWPRTQSLSVALKISRLEAAKRSNCRTNARLLSTTLMANSMPPPPHASCPRGDPGIENSCPHKGAPLLEGILCDRVIECEWPGWQFDLRSGECLTVSEKTQTYEVILEDGLVKIQFQGSSSFSRQIFHLPLRTRLFLYRPTKSVGMRFSAGSKWQMTK